METAFPVLHDVHPLRIREAAELHHRAVPEEQPIAIVCNGTTLAVMMATPADIEDFGLGYLLSEEIIDGAADIERSEVVAHPQGIEVRHWIDPAKAQLMLARRRQMVGPTGCGLCGIESLEQAMRALPPVHSTLKVRPEALRQAVADLRALQVLNASTRGVHAAALWHPEQGHRLVREDVGRHNTLDKLIGAMAVTGTGPGVLLLTSRVSIDLIQKAAIASFEMIAAISVPTNRAIEAAESAGITLVGVARDDGFEIFSHPHRIAGC